METSPEPQESQELDEAPLEPQEPSKLLEQEVEMETPPEPQDSPKRQEPLEQRVEMETQPEPHHYSKRQEPQVPQDLEIWCLIVGMVGTAFPVVVKGTDRVWELQKTIKNEAVEIFGDFNAAQLRLFLAKKENGQWLSEMEVKDIENGDTEPAMPLLDRGHLASMSRLAAIFEDRDTDAVHILIPAPMKTSDIEVIADITGKRKRSNGDVETMEIAKEELAALFDVLGKSTQTGHNLITTSGLSEFWKGYGGFPSSYFIRREEVMLWGLVMRLLSKRKMRIVLTGSLGVGKSCFVALLSFYLAFVEKRKVLVVRRLKVRDKKSFEHGVWKKLNKGLDANESIPNDIPRVLVVVGPDARTCKRFTLSNAPAPDDFMVCCYDPLNFLRRSLHARIA
ncbi:Crinkler effector protein 115 [Phytophthora ramorum]|uniref:Crinkler effector protein 115 n=1 Tax=Phytophthora ramorum TaxID=164328 RepID=UPI0030B766E8|nr:Crinkler effector protein 115 [Phytophthora ramorum]